MANSWNEGDQETVDTVFNPRVRGMKLLILFSPLCVCVVLLLHLTVNISGMFLLVGQGPRARTGAGAGSTRLGQAAAAGRIDTRCRMGVSESASI